MQDRFVTFLGMTMERRTRWNFNCEAVNVLFMGIFLGIINPFIQPLAVRLGATPLQIWLLTAGPFIGNALAPIWARMSFNSRKLPWVVVPNALWRGGLGLIGLVKSPAALTAIHFGTHVVVASANPAYGSLVQKVFPPALRGRLMGYIRLGLAASMLPTTLLAGRLIDRYGVGVMFPIAGVMGVIAITAYAFTREPVDAPPPSGPLSNPGVVEGLKLAVSDPTFRRFLLAAVVFHGGVLVAQPLYAVYQVRQMALSNEQISWLSLAWNVAWLPAFALWGRVIDRKGPAPVVMAAALFYLGMPLAYGLGGGSLPLVALGHMCQGVADAALDLGGWNLILATNPERVGSYTSASMVVTALRGSLGPMLGSWMLGAAGFQLTFLTAAALVAVGAVIWITGKTQRPAD
ncbi:MAG TPA: MFS transporter [Symbiobacteriaceae bacterium]|nr:MFS transporter [Symbiobacteriaceae bacterium]